MISVVKTGLPGDAAYHASWQQEWRDGLCLDLVHVFARQHVSCFASIAAHALEAPRLQVLGTAAAAVQSGARPQGAGEGAGGGHSPAAAAAIAGAWQGAQRSRKTLMLLSV